MYATFFSCGFICKSTCRICVALAGKQFKFIQAIYYCCAFRHRTYILYLSKSIKRRLCSVYIFVSMNLCIFCLHLIESKLLCLKFQSHKIFKLLTIYRPYPVLKCIRKYSEISSVYMLNGTREGIWRRKYSNNAFSYDINIKMFEKHCSCYTILGVWERWGAIFIAKIWQCVTRIIFFGSHISDEDHCVR